MRHLAAHHYPNLVRRWQRVASKAGLILREFAESGNHPLYSLASVPARHERPSVYLSAGIHGDEAAAPEALITWVEKNARWLRKFRALIFPCLNPWGLMNNSRLDICGRDLNRCFNNPRVPQIRAHLKILGRAQFDLALMLHEDYDAKGLYIYEVAQKLPHWGEELLAAALPGMMPDTRKSIDGRRNRSGLVRRKITPDLMPDWPEAFVLHFSHATRTFTIETPSEFAMDERVAAHEAILSVALAKCLAAFSPASANRFPFPGGGD